jgi:hypothetical protein
MGFSNRVVKGDSPMGIVMGFSNAIFQWRYLMAFYNGIFQCDFSIVFSDGIRFCDFPPGV